MNTNQGEGKTGKAWPRLGDEVKDLISGAKGIAIAEVRWINGVVRLIVQGPVDKDGKLPDPNSFDVQTLEVLRAAAVEPTQSYSVGNASIGEFDRGSRTAAQQTATAKH